MHAIITHVVDLAFKRRNFCSEIMSIIRRASVRMHTLYISNASKVKNFYH